MTPKLRSARVALACCCSAGLSLALPQPLSAQPSAAGAPEPAQSSAPAAAAELPRSTPLALVARASAAGMAGDALRAALEAELGVAVALAQDAPGAHVLIEGDALSAVHVAFVRVDGSRVERTVDVSSLGSQATEAAALLAANLIRDEAAELLADLKRSAATTPAPAPPLAASAPPTPAAKPAAPPPVPPAAALPRGCESNGLRHVAFGADFLPYLGMSALQHADTERGISLNLLGGYSGGLRGFAASGLFNYTVVASCGLQLSTVANIVTGPSQGALISFVNITRGRVTGLQLGLVDIATQDVDGSQIGLVNINAGALDGLQLGLANVTTADALGAELGLINVNKGGLQGAQLGLINYAAAPHGLHMGLVNVATRSFDGAQLGLVNVTAGKVQGLQLGLVNVARDADAAIGLISVLSQGRTQLDVWASDANLVMLGLKHGGRRIYNIYGLGIKPAADVVYAAALGLGVRLWTSPDSWSSQVFAVDLDGVGYSLFAYDRDQRQIETASVVQLRLPISWQPTSWLALVASPALNLALVDASNDVLVNPLELGSRRLTSSDAALAARLGPGFTFGVRLF